MKWYPGGIAEAIGYSKSKGAIFIVYIEGTDEQSQKISSLIENGALGKKLEQEHFVAIKLEAGSVPHQQFSEIYKEPSVPSIYFIGKSGTPLDIITGNDNLEDVTKRVDNILSKAGITTNTTGSSAANLSASMISAERTEVSDQMECKNGVCQIKSDEPSQDDKKVNLQKEENIPDTGNHSASSENIGSVKLTDEEKIQRAQMLLEVKRKEKEREEKENERLRELERRKMGQNVQQMKKWQEDQELKQLKEERDREKRENQQARERVLAQIAQDRVERLSKSQPQTQSVSETPKPTQPTVPSVKSNTTRLQFRLPDGSSNTQEFASSDPMQAVVSYIKANLKLPFNDFTLSTTFPRREFTNNDYSQTLVDLQLVPNAVILVLPANQGMVSTHPGGTFSSMIWSFLAPIWNIFGYLKIFIFGTNPNVAGSKRPAEESTESRVDQQKKRVRETTVIKRQGNSNIHRLGDNNDSDDEKKTWNGNSTQQM
nr:UBX domain-containing protein 4-like [Leptinotarsa decemlineata]